MTSRSATRGWKSAIAAISFALLAASCGAPTSDANDPAEPLGAVARDADIAELAAAFAACPEPLDAIAPAAEFVESAYGWMDVIGIAKSIDDYDHTNTATVLTANQEDVAATTEQEVTIHGSYWPGVEWALANGGQVWFAIGDPATFAGTNTVIYVLAYTPDGSAFFPGRCQHAILYEPLQEALGDVFDERMRDIPERTGPELVTALRGQLPEQPPDIVILNPETAPETLLSSLQFAVVHVTLSAELGSNYTICTRVEAGWNDCFVPDARASSIGLVVDAFIDDSGVLEVWLMDADANLLKPIELLGTVNIPLTLAGEKEIALRIEVDTAQLGKGAASTADLVEAMPLKSLDLSDPDWPGLIAGIDVAEAQSDPP